MAAARGLSGSLMTVGAARRRPSILLLLGRWRGSVRESLPRGGEMGKVIVTATGIVVAGVHLLSLLLRWRRSVSIRRWGLWDRAEGLLGSGKVLC